MPGRKNSLQVQNKGNGTTLKLLAKTGHIWQNAQFGVKVHFADESIPNRVKVEMQSTESAYRTTTLTTKPLDPAVGAGQSAIRYDPNGGDGDAFRKAGDPGTQATTPEAATFLRKGYAFAGWNTKADGTGVAYQAGADVAYPAEGRHPDPVRAVGDEFVQDGVQGLAGPDHHVGHGQVRDHADRARVVRHDVAGRSGHELRQRGRMARRLVAWFAHIHQGRPDGQ